MRSLLGEKKFTTVALLQINLDKHIYIYIYRNFVGAGRNVQPIEIKFGTQFSLDVNKNWLIFGDFSSKGVEIVWGLKS